MAPYATLFEFFQYPELNAESFTQKERLVEIFKNRAEQLIWFTKVRRN